MREMHAELLVRFPRAVEDVPSGALRHGGAAMSEGYFRASAHGSLPGRTTLDHADLTPDQLFLRAVPAFFVNVSGGQAVRRPIEQNNVYEGPELWFFNMLLMGPPGTG